MGTGDVIALITLVFTVVTGLALKPLRAARERRRCVGQIVAAGVRYLAASGASDEVLAERGEARNDLGRAASDAADTLQDARLNTAVQSLSRAMSSDDSEGGEPAVREALAAVHRRRWR